MQSLILDTIRLLTLPYRREYLALFGSLILVALEVFIRIITLGLRTSILYRFEHC